MYSHPGRSVMVERAADGDFARVFLAFSHPEPGTVNRHDTTEIMHTIHRAFAEDRWRSSEIIDTLQDARDLYFDTVSQIKMNCWSTGRIALVGDAAYAPAFLSGQGTSAAIAGAYVLASELASCDVPQRAFAAYEHRLRGFAEKNQDLALRNDSTVIPHTKKQLTPRNRALALARLLRGIRLVQSRQVETRTAATDLALHRNDICRRRH